MHAATIDTCISAHITLSARYTSSKRYLNGFPASPASPVPVTPTPAGQAGHRTGEPPTGLRTNRSCSVACEDGPQYLGKKAYVDHSIMLMPASSREIAGSAHCPNYTESGQQRLVCDLTGLTDDPRGPSAYWRRQLTGLFCRLPGGDLPGTTRIMKHDSTLERQPMSASSVLLRVATPSSSVGGRKRRCGGSRQ